MPGYQTLSSRPVRQRQSGTKDNNVHVLAHAARQMRKRPIHANDQIHLPDKTRNIGKIGKSRRKIGDWKTRQKLRIVLLQLTGGMKGNGFL